MDGASRSLFEHALVEAGLATWWMCERAAGGDESVSTDPLRDALRARLQT